MGISEHFAGSFERLDAGRAADLLAATWGIEDAALQRLETERDDSFRVDTDSGSFVLKVAHPDDDPLDVNLQTAAMSFASELEPRLPLQRVLLSRTGEVEPVVDGRVARLLTWLPGHPVDSAVDPRVLGETLGMLNSALSAFDHPAAHRELVWDVARLDLVRPLAEQHREVREVVALWDALDLTALPRQVVHNDFHPGNLLAQGGRLTGILDFGDTVHTVRVADLAIALCYFGMTDEFVQGFASIVPLRDDERAALPVLVAARFAQRIVLNQLLDRSDPEAHLAALRTHLERIT